MFNHRTGSRMALGCLTWITGQQWKLQPKLRTKSLRLEKKGDELSCDSAEFVRLKATSISLQESTEVWLISSDY